MTTYRSTSFESINESQARSEARAKNLLPADAWTESVDEGHHIAFFSHDEAACIAVNSKITEAIYVGGEHEEVVEQVNDDGSVDWVGTGKMIAHYYGYPRLNWTPQRHTDFIGWEKVGE